MLGIMFTVATGKSSYSSNVGAKELKDLSLLVPNIELTTKFSPQFLPG